MGCQGCKKMVEVRMMSARFDEKNSRSLCLKRTLFYVSGRLEKVKKALLRN